MSSLFLLEVIIRHCEEDALSDDTCAVRQRGEQSQTLLEMVNFPGDCFALHASACVTKQEIDKFCHDKIIAMKRHLSFILLFILFSFACSITSNTQQPQDLNVPSGNVLFQDDFANSVSGWDRLTTPEGTMDYDGGGYRLLINALNTNFWSTPHKNFADVRMEVDSGKVGGSDENRIGLICRFTGSEYYFFLISSDGFYGIGLYSGGQAVLIGQNEMQSNSHIKTGLAVNHLRADCIGNTLTFFVNGFQIASVQNSALTTGDVGLLAGTFNQAGVDVIFDNFVVLKP